MRTHSPTQCEGHACCIHHPSDHHMRDWPLNWRADTGVMERICEHGVGHPDPDHLDYARSLDATRAEGQAIHGCDGCCWSKP